MLMNEIIIDEPVDFDIWARVDRSMIKNILDWLYVSQKISRSDAFRFIFPKIALNEYMRIYAGYGWDDLQGLINNLPPFVIFGTAVLTEQDCSPDYTVDYCNLHKLYHREGRCPICTDNYIHKGYRDTF